MDQLYATDALHRLTSFKRGNLNGNKDDITCPYRKLHPPETR
jgi:hypothetical protein